MDKDLPKDEDIIINSTEFKLFNRFSNKII